MKKKLSLITLALLFFLFAAISIRIVYIANTSASDTLKPNFEMDSIYQEQNTELSANSKYFYGTAKYLFFQSDKINRNNDNYAKNYRIDFGDIPVNQLIGLTGEYQYFIDSGKAYNTAEHMTSIGMYHTALIKVEKLHLLNQKIEIKLDTLPEDILCSYMKTVYLSMSGKKIIHYRDLEFSDHASVYLDCNENGSFLKAIYIFSLTKDGSALAFHLKDRYNHMEIS